MKVFWASIAAIVILTVAAWAGFGMIDMSAQDVYSSSGSVRL